MVVSELCLYSIDCWTLIGCHLLARECLSTLAMQDIVLQNIYTLSVYILNCISGLRCGALCFPE